MANLVSPLVVPRGIGIVLVLGALVSLIGAVTPPYRQWMASSPEEFLRLVAVHPGWTFLHAAMGIGAIVTAIGLLSLAGVLVSRGRGWLALAAGVVFAIAAALWIVEIGFRLSVVPWGARELVRTGAIPDLYPVLRDWSGIVFGAHMALSYLALSGLGVALLGTPSSIPRWAGWTAAIYGAVAVPGLLTPAFQAPIMIYLVPFLLGVLVVRGAP
jgi:hypothetical protein